MRQEAEDTRLSGQIWSLRDEVFLNHVGNEITLFILFKDFIYFLEKRGGKKRGRETLMCETNIDWLPLACP